MRSYLRTTLALSLSLALFGAGCSSKTSSSPATPSTPASPSATFSFSQVAEHKVISSCWTIVNGKVYDVTNWITKHPGGQQMILSMCGKDASAEFTDEHGGQRRPERELANFQIGTLQP